VNPNATGKDRIKRLLGTMLNEVECLLPGLWSREELIENKNFIDTTNQKINNMIDRIVKNLYWYEKTGWKQFIPDQDAIEKKERDAAIQKEKARLEEWFKGLGEISDFYALFPEQIVEGKLYEKLSQYGYHSLKQAHVLDVGCRSGKWLRQLLNWGALPEKMVGLDFDDLILDHAKQLSAPGIQWIRTFPDELPFADGKVELILLFGVLMHILDASLRTLIGQELLRLLSDDGVIITYNLNKGAEKGLEPFLAYTTKGLDLEELVRIFPNCFIDYEPLSQCGIAVIRKKLVIKGEGI